VTCVINLAVGCHYFQPGLQLPSQPLRRLLPISLLGEQRHDGCEQFAQQRQLLVIKYCTRTVLVSLTRGCDLNPGPSALESSTLTTRLPSHSQLLWRITMVGPPPHLYFRYAAEFSNHCRCRCEVTVDDHTPMMCGRADCSRLQASVTARIESMGALRLVRAVKSQFEPNKERITDARRGPADAAAVVLWPAVNTFFSRTNTDVKHAAAARNYAIRRRRETAFSIRRAAERRRRMNRQPINLSWTRDDVVRRARLIDRASSNRRRGTLSARTVNEQGAAKRRRHDKRRRRSDDVPAWSKIFICQRLCRRQLPTA